MTKKLIAPEFSLVGEPSDGHLCYANKGLLVFHGTIKFEPEGQTGKDFSKAYKGKSGHSSAPQTAQNALEMALDDLEKNPEMKIGKCEGSIAPNVIPGHFVLASDTTLIPRACRERLIRIRKVHRNFQTWLLSQKEMAIFEPSSATSNWTILERIENEIHYQIECRTLPDQDTTHLQKKLLEDLEGDLELLRQSPACHQPREGSFGKQLEQMKSSQHQWITKSGSNEAYFHQKMGSQVFVHGPGRSYGNIHSPNERIQVSSLHQARDFYARVIESICLS